MSTSCSQWLYDLCRGIDFEAVKPRQLPKSIGCSKNFPGKTSLATKEQVQPLGFCFAKVFKKHWCSYDMYYRKFLILLFCQFIFSTSMKVQYWLHQLALELEERLTKDREAVRENLLHGFYNCSDIHSSLFFFLPWVKIRFFQANIFFLLVLLSSFFV